MAQSPLPFDLTRILSFDLELDKDHKLRHLGAVLDQQVLSIKGNTADAVSQLEQLAQQSDMILGHNILSFDLPWLANQSVPLQHLFDKPIIDTLYLSPLAFPANPYHRLVKDYKLVRDTLNDPVNDARLALTIFTEQLEALQNTPRVQLQLYQYLFTHGVSPYFNTQGLALVFATLTQEKTVNLSMLPSLIKTVAQNRACPQQLNRVIGNALTQPQQLLPLAYACAWLPVSGGNSVLPPWIWHHFPYTAEIIRLIREEKCQSPDCPYCNKNHDARRHLQQIFTLDDFRSLPDGTPLQRQIIEHGLTGQSLLGILPTSGGKSLCYQLPAIVRNQRNGSLTVIISPLQALMKDQVDNLKHKAGIEGVAAISGMLTLPERGTILEQVRLGDIALLYLSPEQLRNQTVKQAIRQRQIGGWVFDEAHCLSKWGHDFRPDYLYCASVIESLAEEQKVPVPPVFCYTATAKLDVINDICSHFTDKLPAPMKRFEGGVERVNLQYEVIESRGLSKHSQVLSLLEQFFGNGKPGSCVIYCATRRSVDKMADALSQQQTLPVARFYSRMENSQKKETLEGFIAGTYRIVCATNAFGMGIDKDDVRLVIHVDIPGSLENYLQEAGRAGRDTHDAHCVLLFDEQDIEKQFQLQAISEVSHRDIAQIFRGIKRKANKDNQLVATCAELINQPDVDTSFGADDSNADTKVKTAIAWLERAGFIERRDNITQVFQGKPLFDSMAEAQSKLAALNLKKQAEIFWNAILQTLLNASEDEGLSADHIAEEAAQYLPKSTAVPPNMDASQVMRILAQMADIGLISRGLMLTAQIRAKGKDNATIITQIVHAIELSMLESLQELLPNPESGIAYPLHLRQFNQKLIDLGHDRSNPALLRNLLFSWSQDARQNGQKGSIDFRYISREHYQVCVNRNWNEIRSIIERRHKITAAVLDCLQQKRVKDGENNTRQVTVSFSMEEIIDHLRLDTEIMQLRQFKEERDQQTWLLKGAERALLYLHEQHAIILQNGLAVFRSAMSLHLKTDKQQYVKANYQPLAQHYQQKIIQIHVMNEYARVGLEKIKSAQALVKDYFSMEAEKFLPLYFKGRRKILDMATSENSWKRIVEDLHNQAQEQIVQAGTEQNLLVLAGPGSGKSKVIVHRCAYLMRIRQVDPRKILLLCYNHNAAVSLRRRLVELMGPDGRRVNVQTFHGLALSLTGQAIKVQESDEIDFSALLNHAIALLKGEDSQLGLEMEDQRERLLGGLQFILVDEYQDIDESQYQLIAALVGKNESEDDARLHLMAVGDDDQSIYAFREANVSFIRQFEKDYETQTHYLTWNYRSTHHIIRAANQLIEHNHDRMKGEHPIEIDENRRLYQPGGRWDAIVPGFGKIVIQSCLHAAQQAGEVIRHIRQIQEKDPDCPLESIAILARWGIDKEELAWVRSALQDVEIPYRYNIEQDSSFPVHRCREIVQYRQWIKSLGFSQMTPETLASPLPPVEQCNRWQQLLHELIGDWKENQGEIALPASHFDHFLTTYFNEKKRHIRFGKGILLSTVHGVKGEEFEHVIILGGSWQTATRQAPESLAVLEEERRIFYVAMTRAISRLVIMQRHDQPHPHLPLLTERLHHEAPQASAPTRLRRFALLGMKKLKIGFAGAHSATHPLHQRLSSLQVDMPVQLKYDNNGIIKIHHQNNSVAQLSTNGQSEWHDRMPHIKAASVIAIIQRSKEQEQGKYKESARVENWELPIVQIEYEE
ncbi:RecQ family ATP-dependent DNA helicase [Dickeya zeae]|uniref:RecQ family ATP-dependent DNA helicase n=1 Tax=Dickeya zeae TaxID=204042 RepID=UPI001C62871A|nr:RecQ family ATP-dependent DNA helicase [Dickeya zeae]